ncbi:nose resistant to fluoxetine protein 6-like [Anopheles nili]|uniref:nose resistant to fluoxetine protein 6-like n=1 Tax=Anopheles nili TaxID=185578 RepID=UPI00237B1F0E|nr:nose resistant to fluoxetine protein 6-like [Anopheles nili]
MKFALYPHRCPVSPVTLSAVVGVILSVVWHLPAPVEAFDVLFGYNESEYWRIPALHVYDSIEQCLHNKPRGVFCIAKVVIKPDARSEIWGLVKKYSKYTFQYNHDVLTRGVCLERCASVLEKLGPSAHNYYVPKFNVSKRFTISDWLLPNVTEYRESYGHMINVCQNYDLRKHYNLTGYAEIEECTTNDNLHRPLDILDVCYLTLLATLVTLAIGSQWYDSKLARASADENHYTSPLKSRASTLATAFSIRRNWARLMHKSTRCQYQQDLDFIDMLRVLMMSLILLMHVLIGMGMCTSQNPLAMEQFSSHVATQMIFSLSPFFVDVFLCISGLLLTVQFLQHTENKRFRLGILWEGLANRYLRSFPVYAVLMLFTVSRYDTFQTTPSGYRIMSKVRLICRKKWWINFLYINNYYQPEEQCLIHTWYLAADFQLFVVGLALLTFLWRFPKATLWTIVPLGVLGFVMPMVNTYVHAVDAMMPLTLKGNEYQLWYDRYFVPSYQVTEMHFAAYFAGMIIGLLYHKTTNKDIVLPLVTIRRMFTMSCILMVCFALHAPIYNIMQFSKPSIWMAVVSGAHKVTIAVFYSLIMLLLAFHDRDSTIRRWLRGNALSRAMARLGFGFYLVQMSVLKIVFANYPEDTRINRQLVVTTFFSTFMLSYAIALVVFLFVEKPFDMLLKVLLDSGRKKEVVEKTSSVQESNSISVISSVIAADQLKANGQGSNGSENR